MKRILMKVLTLVFAVSLIISAGVLTGAKCTPLANGYVVTFETYGGTEYDSVKTLRPYQEVQLPKPEKAGFVFVGWYEDENFEKFINGDKYLPTKDITLHAKWREVDYTVTFVSNGGTEYERLKISGEGVSLPTPERADYIFCGWYLEEDFSGEPLPSVFIPSNDYYVTLYAKWQAIDYVEISFVSNGGTEFDNMRDLGSGVTLPKPEKYGYKFIGWYFNGEFSGEKTSDIYHAEEDITLYAKWEEVVYLYLYMGENNDYIRMEYAPNTVIEISQLEIPEDLIINGTACPFLTWANEEGEPVSGLITLENHTDLFAIFDDSLAPVKFNFIKNADGSYTSVKNGIATFIDNGNQEGGYSVDITFTKGASGGVNAIFRVKLSGMDYPYIEVGTEYLSAGFFPETGIMQIYRVKDGVLTNFAPKMALATLPESWQEKFNGAIVGERVTMNFVVNDYGNGFEILVDGEKIYTCNDQSILNEFKGTGFGARSTTIGSKFSNYAYAPFKTVTLESNGGIEVESVRYALGKLVTDLPLKENLIFEGWYYDEQLNSKVDLNNPNIHTDTTLYAGYKTAEINVTLYDGEEKILSYGYAGEKLYLPTFENRANRIFTGWYYNRELTIPVDKENPGITQSTALYAGWRLPKHDSFVANADGSYSIYSGSPNGAFVVAESNEKYTEYKLSYTVEKGVTSGAATLAFRMNMYEDNVVDGKSLYLTFGLNTAATNGRVECGYSNGSGRYVSIKVIPLTDTPLWNETWQAGGSISVTLSVRDYGSTIEYYVNGELANVLTDANLLSIFNGVGYGIRSSAKDITYRPSISKINSYNVTLISDGEEYGNMEYIEGYSKLPVLDKDGFVFTGWYADEKLTQKVDIVSEDCVLYAGYKQSRFKVSLVTNCENQLDAVDYESGAITLPTPTTQLPNKLFNGWYYDQSLTQAVNAENPVIESDITLYAGWRYPSRNFTESNGVYSVGTADGVVVVGESEYEYTEYSLKYNLTLGVTTGAATLTFRMKLYNESGVDYKGNEYMTFGLNTAQTNGGTALGYSNPETGRFVSLKSISKSAMPASWQELYAQASGTVVQVVLSLRDYGNYIEIFANGDYICTYDDQTYLNKFNGKGYGIRSSADNMSYTMVAREMKEITFKDGEETVKTAYMASAMNLPEITKEGFTFIGWYSDNALTQKVEKSVVFNESTVLYAGWEKADCIVTLVSNCENEYESVSYSGGAIELPTPTTKSNRVFTGWYYDKELTLLVDAENPAITQSTVLYAGWRLPTHYNMTVKEDANGNPVYECKTTVIAITGETPYDLAKGEYTEYSASFDFVKGSSSSSLFFAFRMTGNTDDNRSGEGWYFLNFGIQMSTGKYGFGYVGNSGYVGIVFTAAPQTNGWYQYFNGVAKGGTVTCAITVRDYGDCVECYLNGYLVYTYTGEYLTKTEYQGIGYGIFTKNISIAITYYDMKATLISTEE